MVLRCLIDFQIERKRKNLLTVVRLNLILGAVLTLGNQINACALTTKSARATNTMNIVLTLERKLVVDDNRNLLNINTARKQVR